MRLLNEIYKQLKNFMENNETSKCSMTFVAADGNKVTMIIEREEKRNVSTGYAE